MIRLHDVTRRFRRGKLSVTALDAIDLSVQAGEFVALRGPSGSGKTTLLMIAGGLLRPSSGRVEVAGQNVYALPGRQRAALRAERIGFVFQAFHLVPYLTVLDNALLAQTAAGLAPDRQRAQHLIGKMGLASRLGHRPEELSAGEKQRLVLVRALMRQPEIVLADEPTGNLDDASAAAVMAHLRDAHRQGATIVLATHDARLSEGIDRTVELSQGRLTRQSGGA